MSFSLAFPRATLRISHAHYGCAMKWWRCCMHTHWEHGNTSTRTWSRHFWFTMEKGKERKRHDTIGKIGDNSKDIYKERVRMWYYIHRKRLMYKGKEWKDYKRGEVRKHFWWMKESKWGRGHQRRGVWTKEVGGSIATWKDGGEWRVRVHTRSLLK